MNFARLILVAALQGAFVTLACAGPRSSAAYSLPLESVSAGGARTSSASYQNDGNVNDMGAVSSPGVAAQTTVRQGYVGQLYEVAAVKITPASVTLDEGSTRQLAASAELDDATTVILVAADVNWSVANGSNLQINRNGLLTAGRVYLDSSATVQARWGSGTGTLGLTILNLSTDDFGLYAGDGLPDSWQVQYFGLNNPLAAPDADADGTGQDNRFKYIAGLNPTDPASRFVTAVGTLSGQHTITISPCLPGRTYNLEFSEDLNQWQPLTETLVRDNGQVRTLTDPKPGKLRFYRVVISQP